MSHDDEIRRLLAEARHTEPIPPDVAGRLDGVLADLRAERPVRANVTDLAAARRRRRVRTLLVAAAAVVVVGVGVDQVRDWSPGAGSDSSGSSASVEGEASADGAAGGDSLSPLDDAEDAPAPAAARPVRISTDRFARQVAALQAGRAELSTGRETGSGALEYSADAFTACALDVGRGRVVPVRYDGAPGVLVFRPVRGDSQVVDLYLCGGAEPTRSITLPAP